MHREGQSLVRCLAPQQARNCHLSELQQLPCLKAPICVGIQVVEDRASAAHAHRQARQFCSILVAVDAGDRAGGGEEVLPREAALADQGADMRQVCAAPQQLGPLVGLRRHLRDAPEQCTAYHRHVRRGTEHREEARCTSRSPVRLSQGRHDALLLHAILDEGQRHEVIVDGWRAQGRPHRARALLVSRVAAPQGQGQSSEQRLHQRGPDPACCVRAFRQGAGQLLRTARPHGPEGQVHGQAAGECRRCTSAYLGWQLRPDRKILGHYLHLLLPLGDHDPLAGLGIPPLHNCRLVVELRNF
mmetsp:Transcript_73932/g.204030  ORF Transcript_73932/g.204030 Transcript_73932/m.204030 type:complete len:301 (-) Transcript_73932:541-1443(-)